MNHASETSVGTTQPWVLRLSEWVSEHCSSILVKETRQALKSKQFVWSYFVLLICVGFWTLLGISFSNFGFQQNYYQGNAGRDLLFGFLVILGFPLCLIIPFAAYRSLAREFEDGTLQLISITTMKPYQIIVGKFGSAVLQMLVYLSVLAPCIMFTYLLRGIGLDQILICLGIAVGGSICLTILGLFLAGAFRSRTLSVGVSVLFVLLLGWLYVGWCLISAEIINSRNGLSLSDVESKAIAFGFVALFGSSAALLLVAAASQISFPADNRSTRIRAMMVVQHTLFLAWVVTMVQLVPYEEEMLVVMVFILGHYWLFMGLLTIGESPQLSRRVQRSLPHSVASKSLLSFLMPGPGRGFLFAVLMAWSGTLAIILMALFQRWLVIDAIEFPSGSRGRTAWSGSEAIRLTVASLVSCFYVMLYLAIAFLLARVTLHRTRRELPTGVGPIISLIAGILIVILPMFVMAVIQFQFIRSYRNSYSPLQVFNWYWTTVEIIDGPGFGDSLIWFGLLAVPAAFVILLALLLASRDLLYHPIPVPERVLIDQQKPKLQLPAGETIEEIFGNLDG